MSFVSLHSSISAFSISSNFQNPLVTFGPKCPKICASAAIEGKKLVAQCKVLSLVELLDERCCWIVRLFGSHAGAQLTDQVECDKPGSAGAL